MGNFLVKIAPNSGLSTDVFPPSSTFEPERDMPDLSGKITLVTGGNAGIGYNTVKQLLLKNAKVYLAARSADKAAEAIRKLNTETGKTAIFLKLDLADLPSVRRAAMEFLARESRLDILFNNGHPFSLKLASEFGTNVIGHYFLTKLLLPALTASYEASRLPARIINTSSAGHKSGPARDAWLKPLSPTVATWRLYGQSKLGNIIISNHFARRTRTYSRMPGWLQLLMDWVLPPPAIGAYTQLWAGTTARPAQITGQYLIPYARIGKASPIAANSSLERETIAYLEEQVREF
ncbi:hypothetical protein B0H17DRAFT_1092716 [Mycena rosella]|uniref:NAD(P)-binding protein n=1 Tax=Mycena rosella TaxID=1033263 RepID=A0AAD7CUE4_MYCRO|nr:hypothetical protein B0H17DRAFT_1092716 [Mycena rosella]